MNPIKLIGPWTEGYSLDKHTISSEYIGDDAYGHGRYNTIRTELGELLYRIKYRYDFSTVTNIIKLAIPFLDVWLKDKKIDVIMPVPASKERNIQPVNIIAEAISTQYGISYYDKALEKFDQNQSKDMDKNKKNLKDTIHLVNQAIMSCNILLIDDLYSTGNTLAECVRVLKTDKMIKDVYVLTITRTR